jgi:hypothetical protein
LKTVREMVDHELCDGQSVILVLAQPQKISLSGP